MPSMHIPEGVFKEYVDREGGYTEAQNAIKEALREDLAENE